MDCSPPGSSVQGIFQARVLECVAIAFSDICTVPARAMSPPHSDTLTLISCLRPFLAPILLPGGPGVEAESRN